jgi:hypothetical protein
LTGPERRYGRRRVLYLAGVIGASALAGCTDDGGTEPGDDDQAGGGDGGGSDDASSGPDGDGETDDNDGGETDDTDGETADDTDGSDDENETDGEGDTDGGDDGTDDSGESPRLRDVFAFEQSYVMEFDTADGTGTWRFHEGDSYFEGTFGGERTEMYRIRTESGVDTYTVSGDQCFKTSVEFEQDDVFDPEQPEADSEEYYASGTETVDGQEAYVFEVEGGTYYLSVATGYPVRFESREGEVVTFRSWGETEPISPPEGECREL